jgi:hypothetical protein
MIIRVSRPDRGRAGTTPRDHVDVKAHDHSGPPCLPARHPHPRRRSSGRAWRGWRGVDRRPANVRLLQRLRRQLLDPPAVELQGGDALADPVIPAAEDPSL